MKIAFLSETNYQQKWPANFPNARTEIAWQIALNSDHFYIENYQLVNGYDWVFLIFPKGGLSLNMEGIKLNNLPNRFFNLYESNFIEKIKKSNKRVAFVQEGPVYYVNDFSLRDQINYFNQVSNCDIIFAHNEVDTNWYKGCYPGIKVTTIPTLMIEDLISDICPIPENKVIISGAMTRWYGGFQSYLIATELLCPIFTTTSHCTQIGEDQLPNLTIIPRISWLDWMKTLSSFKYAINLMPTIAAGTFSLNCSYFGIPCIGNIKVDTQRICFPDLSLDVDNIISARKLVIKLKNDKDFYLHCSNLSKKQYNKYYTLDKWKNKMFNILKL
jgi:hypothetical protein